MYITNFFTPMNPQKPILIITMLLLALGNTIYAVIEYLYNQGKIAPILSGVLFVILFSKLYFDTKRKENNTQS
ncbi:hypothetical protein CAPSP0001_0056 [Capnocytophaga sputigena ATCC 33612]|uniref:Uncharacterized protein n=2 Tax=Capnocytophaga sputigena TaxID=1019 RepID=A0ABM6MLQ3_CAPSP|nr:hypothetical protein CGC55_10925 [Capnocytophaga sputigena]EEB66264.1 hypothetical protein CAPSP0001_0056 [Capnocytophaga sputigena ATCC 33612]